MSFHVYVPLLLMRRFIAGIIITCTPVALAKFILMRTVAIWWGNSFDYSNVKLYFSHKKEAKIIIWLFCVDYSNKFSYKTPKNIICKHFFVCMHLCGGSYNWATQDTMQIAMYCCNFHRTGNAPKNLTPQNNQNNFFIKALEFPAKEHEKQEYINIKVVSDFKKVWVDQHFWWSSSIFSNKFEFSSNILNLLQYLRTCRSTGLKIFSIICLERFFQMMLRQIYIIG